MGLDFTTIKDQNGVALYLIHDGSPMSQSKMEQMAAVVSQKTQKQIVIMSINDENAKKIIEFYDLSGSELVLLVSDDDQLVQAWAGSEIPVVDQIAYLAEQSG